MGINLLISFEYLIKMKYGLLSSSRALDDLHLCVCGRGRGTEDLHSMNSGCLTIFSKGTPDTATLARACWVWGVHLFLQECVLT